MSDAPPQRQETPRPGTPRSTAVGLALARVDVRGLGCCACVAKRWRDAARERTLWTRLDARKLFAARGAAANALVVELIATRFRLEALDLEFCRKADVAKVLEAVATNAAASVRAINLNGLHEAPPAALEACFRACRRLEKVGLFHHVRASDAVLRALGPNLREVSLSGCAAATDAGVAALCSANGQLEKLDLTRCPKLTDASLRSVASLPRLRDLGCYADAGLSEYGALAACPLLERLDCTVTQRRN